MLNGLLKILMAGAIAFGVVFYASDGDLSAVTSAITRAGDDAMNRKADRIAAKQAADEREAAEASEESERKGEDVISVVAKLSTAQPIDATLRLTGVTEANRDVVVAAETSGVVEIAPAAGMRVNEGDLLCRLGIGDRGARRDAAVARLRDATIRETAQARLSERGFAAANSAASAVASADAIRAEIRQIDVDIARREIRAPFSGVVQEGPAEIGALLNVGGACATLIDPDPMTAVAFVPEFQVGDLTPGAVGTATLSTGQTVTGRIGFIANTADMSTRTFRVELELQNRDYALRDGVTTEIALPIEADTAHLLPQSAMTLNDDGIIGVMVVEDGTARFRAVTILRDNEEGVFLTGIGNRATVIVVGQEYAGDGSKVSVSGPEELKLGSRS